MKKLGALLSLVLLIGILSACGSKGADSASETGLNQEKLIIGVTAGPHEQIMNVVKEVAAKDGLEIELKAFSDFVLPNIAVFDGELDANSYQTKPFLDQFNKDRKMDLVTIGKTILNPMGVYSNDYKSIDDIPEGGKFGIPNDPTNSSRALFILEKAGYIELADDKKEVATIHDITSNPKKLEFIELDAAQLPNQLGELAAAAINTSFAINSGLSPKEDSILLETTDSPYINYIVARAENENDPVLKKLVKAYQSAEVKQFIEEEFRGSILPIW